jgi:prevent-host-death family protein
MTNGVSIAQAKRELSRLVNRAAYGHEVIVLLSRGRPKAVLIGIDEYQRLNAEGVERRIVKLGGLWKDVPEITEDKIAQARREMWGHLTEREI